MSDTTPGPRYVVKPWMDVPTHVAPVGQHRTYGYWVVDTTSHTNHFHFDHRVDAQERADRWNRNAARLMEEEKRTRDLAVHPGEGGRT